MLRNYASMLLLGAIAGMTSCGGPSSPAAVPRTVALPQSVARDQGSAGLCWAYALSSLLETESLLTHDRRLSLSPEALAFYNLLEQFHFLSRSYGGDAMPTPAALESLIARHLLPLDSGLVRFPETADFPFPDGLALVTKYGLVPAEVWSFAFPTWPENFSYVLSSLKERFRELMSGRSAGTVTPEEIVSAVLTGPGAFPTAPPSDFIFDDGGGPRRMTAREFATSVVGFSEARYSAMPLVAPDDLMFVKRALAAGHALVISVPVDLRAYLPEWGHWAAVPSRRYSYSGRHAMLLTDFVNAGGRPGAMAGVEIEREVERPVVDLEMMVVRNSWGSGQRVSFRPDIPRGFDSLSTRYVLDAMLMGEMVIVYGNRAAFGTPPRSSRVEELQAPEGSLFVEACRNPATWGPAVTATVEVLKSKVETADCDLAWRRLVNVAELELAGAGVRSLLPLRGVKRLRRLDLARNALEDTEVLGEIPSLLELDVSHTAFSSVAALSRLPHLVVLRAERNAITDLSPLAGLRALETLVVDGNPIADISPLSKLRALQKISFSQTGVSSLLGLSKMPLLREVGFEDTAVESLVPVAGKPHLTTLRFARTRVSDISNLPSLPRLRIVQADFCPIADAQPVSRVPTLRQLSVDGIHAITPELVSRLPELEILSAAGTGIANLDFVRALPRLSELYVPGNGIVDASPLAMASGLQVLDLAGNPIVKSPATCPSETPVAPLAAFCTGLSAFLPRSPQ